MGIDVVSGSGGLVGSESVRHLVETGWDVIGLENDLRATFFGPDASTTEVSRELDWELSDQHRVGDHRWWISDLGEFRRDYPEWRLRYGIEEILREIHEQNVERWTAATA
jgi:hypothetical protein